VLVGGRSSRMGRDKALLPFRGVTLAQFVAAEVAAACGSATLVGDPETYGGLGFPTIPDALPGQGPLGGIVTALRHSASQWNVIVACDMPGISAEFVWEILAAAEASGADVLVPAGPEGRPEPLCAAWNRRALPPLEAALEGGVRKLTDALQELRAAAWNVAQVTHFANVNTPEDWARYALP
jgi:molybdopterin-guanine dinucleotide biosynthesis protein A